MCSNNGRIKYTLTFIPHKLFYCVTIINNGPDVQCEHGSNVASWFYKPFAMFGHLICCKIHECIAYTGLPGSCYILSVPRSHTNTDTYVIQSMHGVHRHMVEHQAPEAWYQWLFLETVSYCFMSFYLDCVYSISGRILFPCMSSCAGPTSKSQFKKKNMDAT